MQFDLFSSPEKNNENKKNFIFHLKKIGDVIY